MSFDIENYVDVPARIRAFANKYPEGSLWSDWTIVTIGDKTYIVVTAKAYRTAGDSQPGVGHAAELYPGKTPYTRDSELMNAETSAWGRAIQALGFDFGKVASAEEVKAAKARQQAFTAGVDLDEPFPNSDDDGDSPYCLHGAMVLRTGEKEGKPWSGYFCVAPKAEACKPVWNRG